MSISSVSDDPDDERISSRASALSEPVLHVPSTVISSSLSTMGDEDGYAPVHDEKQEDVMFEEEPRILSRLPKNYARERKGTTPSLPVERTKERVRSRESLPSDLAADALLPVASSSHSMRGDSEPAGAEAPKGYSTVLSTSSPTQTEAQLLSAILPDLSIEIDEKQGYIGADDVEMTGGIEHRGELEAGAELFP